MLPSNLPARFVFILLMGITSLLSSCGNHNEPTVVDDGSGNTSTPLINLTDGPYNLVVGKELIIGIETKFAVSEPVYVALPTPRGVAIVNNIKPGQLILSGLKAGTASFVITDEANPTATPRTIDVNVSDPPKLVVSPSTLSGRIGQSINLEISTLNQENTPEYMVSIKDSALAQILDPQNNPHQIKLLAEGETTVTIKDTANSLSSDFTLTITK